MRATFAALALALASPLCAQTVTNAPATAEQCLAWSAALAPSCVKVAYTLQFAEGQKPSDIDIEKHLSLKQDYETPGWLVAPDTVLVLAPPEIEPQFVKGIRALHKGNAVNAAESHYLTGHNALLLKLDKPLPETSPVAFKREHSKERFLAVYEKDKDAGSWRYTFAPYSRTLIVSDADGAFYNEPRGLILDDTGAPVRITAAKRTAPEKMDEDFTQWPKVSVAELQQQRAAITSYLGTSIAAATLQFRSPKRAGGDPDAMHHTYFGRSDDDLIGDPKATVQYAVALQFAPKQFLVLKSFENDMTARMDKILLKASDGKSHEAKFVASLAEYGAFIVTCETAPAAPVPAAPGPITAYRDALLHKARITAVGDDLHAQFSRDRLASFGIGYNAIVFPDEKDTAFGFDTQGRLVFFPITFRDPDNGRRSSDRLSFPAALLFEKLQRLDGMADPANVPLPEADENRIAWLGAETQEVTPELALANKATKLYQDNDRSAALVTSVHAGSSAEKMGLQAGDMLLRLHKPGQQAPIRIKQEHDYMREREFPWEHYDKIPPEYFERLPAPWPKVNDAISKTLTQIGIGKTATLEWARNGQLMRAEFTVEQSPPYYGNVDKVELEAVGLTVCDATFEVRQLLGRKGDDPGVIVAAVKAGSASATSGIKPYELITHVNDAPVPSVTELQALLKGDAPLRLTVRRLNRDRVVSLQPPNP